MLLNLMLHWYVQPGIEYPRIQGALLLSLNRPPILIHVSPQLGQLSSYLLCIWQTAFYLLTMSLPDSSNQPGRSPYSSNLLDQSSDPNYRPHPSSYPHYQFHRSPCLNHQSHSSLSSHNRSYPPTYADPQELPPSTTYHSQHEFPAHTRLPVNPVDVRGHAAFHARMEGVSMASIPMPSQAASRSRSGTPCRYSPHAQGSSMGQPENNIPLFQRADHLLHSSPSVVSLDVDPTVRYTQSSPIPPSFFPDF